MGNIGSHGSYQLLEKIDDSKKWCKIFIPYALVTFQLLLTVALGVMVVSYSEIPQFVLHTALGLAIYIFCLIFWFIVACPIIFSPESKWNYPLFVLWTILFAVTLGSSCSYEEDGNVVLEAILLITAASIFITATALCGWVWNWDFSIRAVSWTGIFLAFCLFVIIQIVHPFAELSKSGYSFAAALAFFLNLSLIGEGLIYQQQGAIPAVVLHYLGVVSYLKRALPD